MLGRGEPVYHKDVMIVGFDKIRKSELESFEEKFSERLMRSQNNIMVTKF